MTGMRKLKLEEMDLCHLFIRFFVFSPLRDVLPFTLKLPEAIASAKTQKELEEVAQLGAGKPIYTSPQDCVVAPKSLIYKLTTHCG